MWVPKQYSDIVEFITSTGAASTTNRKTTNAFVYISLVADQTAFKDKVRRNQIHKSEPESKHNSMLRVGLVPSTHSLSHD